MSDIKVVNDQGEEVEEKQVIPNTPDVISGRDGDLMVFQIAKLFDLGENEMGTYRDKIETLLEYAKIKSDDHSPEGLKWALRNLDLRLGTPPMGEKRINYMYRFAKLELDSQRIKAEKEQYLKGGQE